MLETAVNVIKEVLNNNGIKVIKIILFGSRVKENFRQDSN